MSGEQNRIIKKVAKARLIEAGFVQQGSSRVFYKDEKLWLFVAEFQPKFGDNGTFLNLSVMWLWNAKDYFSFDLGLGELGASRSSPFHPYRDDKQFTEVVNRLCDTVIATYRQTAARFVSIKDVAEHFKTAPRKSAWDFFNAGAAFGLAGDTGRASHEFSALAKLPAKAPWELELKELAETLVPISQRHDDLAAFFYDRIQLTRKILKVD